MNDLRGISWLARLVTVAGLAVDAAVHSAVAGRRPPGPGVSQVLLFDLEGIVSSGAALLVLAIGARLSYGLAVVIAGSALVAVVLYRYVDLGSIGPLPDMYEPYWSASKITTAIAEALAVASAAAGIVLPHPPHLPSRRTP